MLIKDLPTKRLRGRALELSFSSDERERLKDAFVWSETKERGDFWRLCDYGDFESAAKLFPEYFTETELSRITLNGELAGFKKRDSNYPDKFHKSPDYAHPTSMDKTLFLLDWKDAQDSNPESKPPTYKGVLLRIKGAEYPVVGYWQDGQWEVCTDNVTSSSDAQIEALFLSHEVTHYAYFGELPE